MRAASRHTPLAPPPGELPSIPSPIARLLADGDEPGHLSTNTSIVMSGKLQGHRSSMAEPYFSSRQKSHALGVKEVAQLKMKASAMSRDFQTLLVAHERQEASLVDLRQKVRSLRQELDARDKAVELARRTVERLAAEKGQLEAGAAATQAYVRKLETRLLAAKHAVELEQRCVQYKSLLDQQAHELHAASERASAAEEAASQARMDVACLKRGLELAAEQLTRSAGSEVPGTLLRAVARGQEEAMNLSHQLADSQQQVAQLTTALEQARAHLEAQHAALSQQTAERQELGQRAEAAEAALAKQDAATKELRRVLDALRPKAGALAEERDELLHQLELQRTAAAEAQHESEQLRSALRRSLTVEKALRDELRRVMAGEGASPSPRSLQLVRSPRPVGPPAGLPLAPGSARRGTAAAAAAQQRALAGSRTTSRATTTTSSRQRHALHHTAAGVAGQGSQRVGSSVSSGGGSSADKAAVIRQASAFDQHQEAEQEQLAPGDLSTARPLLRLQEQCRQRHGSRLGALSPTQSQQQQQHDEGHHQREASLSAWEAQHELGEPLPVTSCTQPPAPAAHEATPAKNGQQQAQQQHPKAPLALDEEIAMLESDLAQLSSAPSPIAQLQKRTAAAAAAAGAAGPGAKAAPLQQLEQQQRSLVPVLPQTLLAAPAVQQQQDAIGAWRPNGTYVDLAAGLEAEPAAATDAKQVPLSPFGGLPSSSMQQAKSPVPHLWHSNPLAGSPAKLALPPTPEHQQQQQLDNAQQEEQLQQAPTLHLPWEDGAVTVRPMPALEPAAAAAAAEVAATDVFEEDTAAPAADITPEEVTPADEAVAAAQQVEGGEQEWQWTPLHQGAMTAAGDWSAREQLPPQLLLTPSLGFLAALQQEGVVQQEGQQADQRGEPACSPLGAGAPSLPSCSVAEERLEHQPTDQPQLQVADRQAPPALQTGGALHFSLASCGSSEQAACSLSKHWDLPSPGSGTTDWLSNEQHRADIEQLEVTSGETPLRLQYQRYNQHRPQYSKRQQQQQEPAREPGQGAAAPAHIGGWASCGWDTASCGAAASKAAAESAPLLRPSQLPSSPVAQPQQPRHSSPFLPGLPLMRTSPSPLRASAAALTAAAVSSQHEQQQQRASASQEQPAAVQQQQQQRHTLFDLADMDMSELLGV